MNRRILQYRLMRTKSTLNHSVTLITTVKFMSARNTNGPQSFLIPCLIGLSSWILPSATPKWRVNMIPLCRLLPSHNTWTIRKPLRLKQHLILVAIKCKVKNISIKCVLFKRAVVKGPISPANFVLKSYISQLVNSSLVTLMQQACWVQLQLISHPLSLTNSKSSILSTTGLQESTTKTQATFSKTRKYPSERLTIIKLLEESQV